MNDKFWRENCKKWKKDWHTLANEKKQLEEELEAYRANDNPQLTAGLHRRIKYLEEENAERNQAMKDADKERDEAKEQAEQAVDDFKKLHKEYKEYEMEYEARYLNMKKQRDSLATAYNAALELTE